QALAERTGDDADLIAGLELGLFVKLDQPVALAGLDLGNDAVGAPRRGVAGHEQGVPPRAPLGVVPSLDDENEQVTRKQRRANLDAPTAHHSALTQPRQVSFKPGQAQALRRYALALWHQPAGTPKRCRGRLRCGCGTGGAA